jgi:predicted nucleic acid-binding protein
VTTTDTGGRTARLAMTGHRSLHPPGTSRTRESLVANELTRFELLAGARSEEHDDLESFFRYWTGSPVTEDATRRAGEYARTYRRSHSGIRGVDYLLAGTVSAVSADLVTVNVRHFPIFDDLRPTV